MAHKKMRSFARLPHWRKLAASLTAAAAPWLGMGCAQLGPTAQVSQRPPAVVRAAEPGVGELPPARPVPPAPAAAQPAPAAKLAPPVAPKIVPVTLDAVLRLAEEKNSQIQVAREKVRESWAQRDIAYCWLPDVYVGTTYLRHEGGIQNQDGTMQHSSFGAFTSGMEVYSKVDVREIAYQRLTAERRAAEREAEKSQLTSDKLYQATSAYIDLMAARTADAVILEVISHLERLKERVDKQAKLEPGLRVEAAMIQADLEGRRQLLRRYREQGVAASARLVWLLDLDPACCLHPADPHLDLLELVDANRPCDELVRQAMSNGPGVKELARLVAIVDHGLEQARGPGRFIPVLELSAAESLFGAGPGSTLDWDNRFDIGFRARWNLSSLAYAHSVSEMQHAQAAQAHLQYHDQKGKLASGVQESRAVILGGREEVYYIREQIRNAIRAYELAIERLEKNVTRSHNEALQALQATIAARLGYVSLLAAYDKAQLQLMLLLGPMAHPHGHP